MSENLNAYQNKVPKCLLTQKCYYVGYAYFED